MEQFDKFVSDERGDIQDQVVTVFVVLILVATIGIVSWQLIAAANTTGFGASLISIIGVISIITAIVIILLLLKIVKN